MSKRHVYIMLVFIAILVVGSGVTFMTKSYHDRELAKGNYLKPAVEAEKRERESKVPVTESAPEPETETGLQEAKGAEAGGILIEEEYDSGDAIYDVYVTEQAADFDQQKEDYYTRLKTLENQIGLSWKNLKEPTAQEEINLAEYEYRVWDSELNAIYQSLRESLTEDAFETLKKEERDWIANRDRIAEKNASIGTSASTQRLLYVKSMTESTIIRTYQLAAMYYGE